MPFDTDSETIRLQDRGHGCRKGFSSRKERRLDGRWYRKSGNVVLELPGQLLGPFADTLSWGPDSRPDRSAGLLSHYIRTQRWHAQFPRQIQRHRTTTDTLDSGALDVMHNFQGDALRRDEVGGQHQRDEHDVVCWRWRS